MRDTRPSLLIADTPGALRLLEPIFRDEAALVCAATHDEALQRCRERRPDALLVGYHFDELRPYRLIREVRSQPFADGVRVVLVRALALHLDPRDEGAIRSAYREIGADEFIDFHATVEKLGAEAAQRLLKSKVLASLGRSRRAKAQALDLAQRLLPMLGAAGRVADVRCERDCVLIVLEDFSTVLVSGTSAEALLAALGA
ncbi:MAG TPA: hypothetical protein VFB08_17395 [Burkholderiales bacterium]|nr:hypothetical protein [Burkholderiales bacterium]